MKTILNILALAISVSATAVAADYQQPPGHRGGLHADGSAWIAADDFTLTSPTAIGHINWWGGYVNGPASPDSFRVRFYADSGGQPGSLLLDFSPVSVTRWVSGLVQDGMTEYYYTAILDSPFVAESSTRYWLSIENQLPVQLGQGWNWELSNQSDTFGVQLFYGGSWHSHGVVGTAFVVPEPSALALLSLWFLTCLLVGWRRLNRGGR